MGIKLIALISILFMVASCNSPTLRPDSSRPASELGVPTLELEACGYRNVGVSGCNIKDGKILGQEIKVRIPYTNYSKKNSTLQIISKQCNIDKVIGVEVGKELILKLKDLIVGDMKDSCTLNFMLSPMWQGQENSGIMTYPISGYVYLVNVAHDATNVFNSKMPYTSSFAKFATRQADISNQKVSIDTQGSKFGVITFSSKETEKPQEFPYQQENPSFDLPVNTIFVLGSALRIDKPNDLSFSFAIVPIADQYLYLREPYIKEGKLYLDPEISVVEIDNIPYTGIIISLKKPENNTFYIRQLTVNGRYKLTYIENNQVKWNLE